MDKRTDIWAFGCVLYELLTGRQAFHGETTTEILAAVLRGEPDWQALPASTPVKIRDLLAALFAKRYERSALGMLATHASRLRKHWRLQSPRI